MFAGFIVTWRRLETPYVRYSLCWSMPSNMEAVLGYGASYVACIPSELMRVRRPVA